MSKKAQMITDSNQASLRKYPVVGLQEEVIRSSGEISLLPEFTASTYK